MLSVPIQESVLELDYTKPHRKLGFCEWARIWRDAIGFRIVLARKRRQMQRDARAAGNRRRVTLAQAYLAYVADLLDGQSDTAHGVKGDTEC